MHDVIIIGAGPSGMTCALNLLRAGRSVLILEKENVGGQMATSPRLENIPGIKSISGVDYANDIFEQIMDLGAEFELEEVINVSKDVGFFNVKTNYGFHSSKAIVIANGCEHRKMGLPHEEELIGKGISFCATCDGAFYKGQEAYLIGDANTAFQYALLLANYCPKVHIFALFNKLFADKILIDRVTSNPNIDITKEMNLVEYIGEKELTGLVFENTKTKEKFTYNTNNVFIAIGQIPHNENFKDLINLDERGFILTNDNMETSLEGMFAIGDTRKKAVRQVSTAIGDASTCSIFVDRYLQNN